MNVSRALLASMPRAQDSLPVLLLFKARLLLEAVLNLHLYVLQVSLLPLLVPQVARFVLRVVLAAARAVFSAKNVPRIRFYPSLEALLAPLAPLASKHLLQEL